MVGLYLLGALWIVIARFEMIPEMFVQIFTGAFAGTAAVGGFAGVAFKDVIVMGIRRATFSNEAGMGSAAMAHSAAKTTRSSFAQLPPSLFSSQVLGRPKELLLDQL
jgi:AGCS family alanine or glycine:cation symporter